MADLTQLSIDELRVKLSATTAIQRTVLAIFGVIVIAWVALGYWRTNMPVFISTIAMGVAVGAATSVTPRSIRAELRRRASGT